ncbi:MAG: single-stranded DNA-binding protein [Myxococcales bacterium]|jgi:single-strand DNA-binding protein
MAEGLNKVMLIGNLGQDPELRFTQSGTAVLNLRLATNERWKDQSGEWKDKTEWHSVIVWGKRGEALNKILSKGSHMYVDGRLQTRSWEDRDGNKRYTTEIVAQDIKLLGGRPGSGGGGYDDGPPPPNDDFAPGGGGGGGGGGDFGDDDIPF